MLQVKPEDRVVGSDLSSQATKPLSHPTAEPPSRSAAEPLSSRAAQQPSRRAAQQLSRPTAKPPSCPAAEPPSRPATELPSRPTAEPPSSRAAELPSSRAAELPSSRAAEPPCRPAAIVPTGAPKPYFLGLCDRADRLSLFDLTSGASPAPPATADSTVRSQWATRDAAARLAVRRHLPTTERAHFSQYKSAQTLYDAVVERYSSPATAALSCLMLPYLFPDLAAFPTVADLITHLRTSDTRYRAALPAEGVPLPPSCPLLLLLLRPTSVVSSRSSPRLPLAGDAAPARARGARELEGLSEAVEVVVEVAEGVGVVVGVVGGGGGVGGSSGGGGGGGGGGGSGGGGGGGGSTGGAGRGSAPRSGSGGGPRQQQQHSRATLSPQQLREWYAARQRGGGTDPCTYVLRTGDRAGEQCGGPHSTQRCFGRLTDAWRHQFPDATEIPRWGEPSRAGVPIFYLDFDAILAAMYAVCDSVEGDSYPCVPLDPGIEAAALGTGEAATLNTSASAAPGACESALSGTTSAQAIHTFTLDSGASRSFFRDRTTLTPLSRPVAVSQADPSGGPVLASFSTVLPCPAAPSGTLSGLYLPAFSTNLVSGGDLQDRGVDLFPPASQRVTHCTCARTGRHLATFTCRPGTSLYTLTTASPPVAESGQVAASSQVVATASRSGPESAPCSCRLLSHQTLLWHHCLGHPSLPRLRDMASRVLVGDVSAFRVWGSRAFVRDLSADKLSPRYVPCVFLGFPPDAPAWQFYHPTSWRVLSSQDVTFDESVPYYRLFPYRTAPLPLPPLFLAPGPPPVDPLPPQGPAPSGVSQVDAVEPVEVAVDSGADRGTEPAGAGSGGAEPEGAVPEGAKSRGAELGGAESGGAESGGAEPRGAETRSAESGGAEPGGAEPGGAEPEGAVSARVASRGNSSRRELLSPQELREWFAWRWSRAARAGGTNVAAGPRGTRPGGTGAAGTGGAAGVAGVGPAGGTAGATGGTGAAGPAGAGAAGATGAGAAGGVGASGFAGAGASEGAGVGTVGARGVTGAGAAAGGSDAISLPASPLPGPSPYTDPSGGLAERREPASRPASPVRAAGTSRRAPRPRPPVVPGTHQMALRPSTAPLRVPLPSPPESSLLVLADPKSNSLRAASPTFTRLLAIVVTDPSFESTAASALVAELVDFAARCRLDYATSLVAESEFVYPPSVGGECALSTDVLEDRQEEFQCFAAALPHLVSTLLAPEGDPDAPDIPTPHSYAEAIEGPYSSQWQAAMDAEMASWKSTGTYVDEVPPPWANIVIGMWIFRVKRPPGSPPVFKARYVARGFSQRQGVDYFQTFSPTQKMTTLRVLLHVAAQCDYELHSLDFSTAFLQGSLHEEIWLRRPPGFTGSFPPGTQWSLWRPVYGLYEVPREWHDTLRTTLAALGFAPSTANPSLFLHTDTSLPSFYILVYVDDLVFATADTTGLAHVKSELLKRHTCTDLGELRNYLGLQIT
ncbi:unnamed protein product [Closterium sp. NIES-54]